MTVTVLLALLHGGGTVMVYVYTPALIVAGSNELPMSTLGPLQFPPESGVPPSWVKRSVEASVVHRVIAPGVPALGLDTTLTVTEAEAGGHGAVPFTV